MQRYEAAAILSRYCSTNLFLLHAVKRLRVESHPFCSLPLECPTVASRQTHLSRFRWLRCRYFRRHGSLMLSELVDRGGHCKRRGAKPRPATIPIEYTIGMRRCGSEERAISREAGPGSLRCALLPPSFIFIHSALRLPDIQGLPGLTLLPRSDSLAALARCSLSFWEDRTPTLHSRSREPAGRLHILLFSWLLRPQRNRPQRGWS